MLVKEIAGRTNRVNSFQQTVDSKQRSADSKQPSGVRREETPVQSG